MRIQTILNRLEKFKSFVYREAHWEDFKGDPRWVVRVRRRKNIRVYCSGCGRVRFGHFRLHDGVLELPRGLLRPMPVRPLVPIPGRRRSGAGVGLRTTLSEEMNPLEANHQGVS